ncbi:hypothetical protein [Vibrio sp. B1Z05]|uniref:hypothetical protein n=1 Tax=Vibrio sp. B1Z05 TaxID=2654980 RepID=UPI00128DCBA2|nr:hypothetical protein [Vibrio sp. B1Z05]MPW37293.1 hypothetical protein [Vibrio sp. B1Z05]
MKYFCTLFLLVSFFSHSSTFVGSELFQGKWSEKNIVYSDLSADFDSCTVMNRNLLVWGTCTKISDNLILVTTKMSVQAFTRDHSGKIITMLLRDNSDMKVNNTWATAVVGVER